MKILRFSLTINFYHKICARVLELVQLFNEYIHTIGYCISMIAMAIVYYIIGWQVLSKRGQSAKKHSGKLAVQI